MVLVLSYLSVICTPSSFLTSSSSSPSSLLSSSSSSSYISSPPLLLPLTTRPLPSSCSPPQYTYIDSLQRCGYAYCSEAAWKRLYPAEARTVYASSVFMSTRQYVIGKAQKEV
jgi:hypothetical protein